MNDSIHLHKSYIRFKIDHLSFPVYLALIPVIYVVPTVLIIFRILSVFISLVIRKKRSVEMNMHIFLVIVASHFMNLLFFFSDYLMYRLPATGLLTSFCARSSPSRFLSLIVFFHFYSAYTVMIFPFLLSFIRFLLIISPHSRHNALRLGLPLVFIYPICFTFFLIPAVGICKQLGEPYPFGSVMVYYYGSYHGIRNSPFYLGNVVVWMIMCTMINALLLLKLSNFNFQMGSTVVHSMSSCRSKSCELSITLTTVSMLLSALLNCIFVVSYLTMPVYINYLTIVKPIGSDCELVVSPWIFYTTHPIFKKKSEQQMMFQSRVLVNTL